MFRSLILASLLAFAAGCASTPVAKQVALASSAGATSEEMDCMSECLESADEDCESCVAQCLKPIAQVAPLAGLK
jgi:hypothetical protein